MNGASFTPLLYSCGISVLLWLFVLSIYLRKRTLVEFEDIRAGQNILEETREQRWGRATQWNARRKRFGMLLGVIGTVVIFVIGGGAWFAPVVVQAVQFTPTPTPTSTPTETPTPLPLDAPTLEIILPPTPTVDYFKDLRATPTPGATP